MNRRARVIGVALGLLVAAVAIDRARRGRRELAEAPAGVMVGDAPGALGRVVIQYVQGASYAAAAYRGFLPALDGEVTVYVLCPDRASYDELVGQVGAVRCRLVPVVTRHAMTSWARDRWVALGGRVVTLLCPRAEAGADDWPARAGDQTTAFDLAAAMGSHAVARRSDLFFDGGDFVADDRTAFVALGVLRRNLQHTVDGEADLVRQLARMLGRKIVLLRDGPDHHAGMFMMAVGQGTVLVCDPSLARPLAGRVHAALPGGADLSPQTQERFDSVARQAAAAGYRVVRIPLLPAYDGRSWLTYVNVILDWRGGRAIVYMPIYQGAEALNDAAEQVWRGLGFEVRRVDCTAAFTRFGSLRCLVNVCARG